MAQSCVFCGNQVVWADVLATREGMRVADIADSRGLLALEEKQQYIHMGMVCAPCCGGKPHAQVEESHCYECGDNGAPRECHDGVTRVLCVPCWYGHYMH